jgi:ferric-dicitrate binding protein FerR (iron transport regulator)
MNDLRFMELVSNWLDSSLTDAESAELQAELEASAERRNEFADVCGLDADLRLMSDMSQDFTLPLAGESGSQARRVPAPAATASDPPASGRVNSM